MNSREYEANLKKRMSQSFLKPEQFLLVEICKLLWAISRKEVKK